MSHAQDQDHIFFVDKPYRWTSFDVIRKLRGGLKIKKMGHAGTLDPLATGLLIVCSGKNTKKINDYMGMEKEYIVEMSLGKTTPSYDLEKDFDAEYPINHITKEDLIKASESFKGPIEQIPPMHSAIKKDGKKLYELARKGKTMELEPRKVIIHEFEWIETNLPNVIFKIKCSKGTYVRSLVRDLGQFLESGAHLANLRRTKIGPYPVSQALEPQDIIEKFRTH